jgi:VanZ family protein
MAVIMGFSSDTGSAKHTGNWLLPIFKVFAPEATAAQLEAMHGLVRKGAHVTEYAVLAGLWFRAFTQGLGRSSGAAGWIALGISLGWALLDEALQSMRPSRTGSGVDVAIDTAGALLAVAVARSGWRRAADWTTTTLLWVGLLGGAVLLAVNALAGVPSGALWLTVPAAALLLFLLHRRRSRRPPTHPVQTRRIQTP